MNLHVASSLPYLISHPNKLTFISLILEFAVKYIVNRCKACVWGLGGTLAFMMSIERPEKTLSESPSIKVQKQ
jgi:hypothetical protein